MTRLILFGAPGSGKGTMGDFIQRDFHFRKISTGDIIREQIQKGSASGLHAKEIMAKGDLLPDAAVIEIVRQRLGEKDLAGGYIMDGFPRTLAQAQALSTVPVRRERAIYFEVGEAEAIARLLARLTCSRCGAIYNLKSKPPKKPEICDQCQGSVQRRADDNEETVGQRIKVYFTQTMPVIEYYQRLGVLSRVDGSGAAPAVYEKVKKLLT